MLLKLLSPEFFYLKCNKYNFGWSFAPDHAEELTVLLRPLAIWGKGRQERGREWEEKEKGRRRRK